MIENRNDPEAKADWTGKPAADAGPVAQTVAPPAPVQPSATPVPAPQSQAPALAAEQPPPQIAANSGYAVFFFPAAIDALGAVVRPYLAQGNGEPHMLCREVDTGGAFIELTVDAQSADGKPQQVELMVPANMVRLIMSTHSDGTFGFGRPEMRY